MIIQPVPDHFRFDLRGLIYLEMFPDGTLTCLSSLKSDIKRKTEDSLYRAYFRAKLERSILFVCGMDALESFIYRIEDLEAFADSIGIERESTHQHIIRWEFNPKDPGKGRFALIDIEFLCGCKLSNQNVRSIRIDLRNQFGWNLILNSVNNSQPLSCRTIRIERNSIKKAIK